jgi:hypothetical protein
LPPSGVFNAHLVVDGAGRSNGLCSLRLRLLCFDVMTQRLSCLAQQWVDERCGFDSKRQRTGSRCMTGQFTVCSVGSGGCCAENCECCADLARSCWQGLSRASSLDSLVLSVRFVVVAFLLAIVVAIVKGRGSGTSSALGLLRPLLTCHRSCLRVCWSCWNREMPLQMRSYIL